MREKWLKRPGYGEDNPNAIALVLASPEVVFWFRLWYNSHVKPSPIFNFTPSFPTVQQMVKFGGRSKRH